MKRTTRSRFGFLRIALGSHKVEVTNCRYNAERIIEMMRRAQKINANFLALNELGITAYTCANHFRSEVLRAGALEGLNAVRLASKTAFSGITLVGAPIEVDGELYNCAVVIQKGRILGIVPKTYLPNAGEFHEKLWFSRGDQLVRRTIKLFGEEVPIGVDLLFEAEDFPGLVFGIEVCEDGWAVIPPHRLQALGGATVLFNLSASNELVAKDEYRRNMAVSHSAQAQAIYGYASAGSGESTSDIVYGAQLLLAELGGLLAEAEPLIEKEDEPLRYADVDVQHVIHERMRDSTFEDCRRTFQKMTENFQRIKFSINAGDVPDKLARSIDAYPFVPQDPVMRNKRCRQVMQIQARALRTRFLYLAKLRGGLPKMIAELEKSGKPLCVIGISGGVDSTECLLVALMVFDELGIPRSLLHCFTLPGFGTTGRTLGNAMKLMELTGVTIKVVDVKARCLLAWQQERKTPFGINVDGLSLEEFVEKLKDLPAGAQDLDFENEQARQRTHILMNNGFVLGTGTLTELAAGWCTYNADHMSMYSVNAGVAKTLIAFLIRWYAETRTSGELQEVLYAIADTAESPELLPVGRNGEQHQKSNDTLGPKDIRDFALYHWVRWGSLPSKILYLAAQAKFKQDFELQVKLATLRGFIWKFITQRYKHSCQPDAAKLGSVSVNPRYDCHMPSDAAPDAWLEELDAYVAQQLAEIPWVVPPTPTKGVQLKAKAKKVLRALLRVDIKKDFMPGGALAVTSGDEIITPVNALSRSGEYDLVIDIEDDHPPHHKSFAREHVGKNPFEFTRLYGVRQQLWPAHCVWQTDGNNFHPDLDRSMVVQTFQKGQDARVDSYSGFYDNGRNAAPSYLKRHKFLGKSTGLAEYLKAQAERLGCDEIQIDVVGVALRYCVSYTATDGRAEKYRGKKFKVRVVEDCVRAITFKDGEYEAELKRLRRLGIELIQSSDVLVKMA